MLRLARIAVNASIDAHLAFLYEKMKKCIKTLKRVMAAVFA